MSPASSPRPRHVAAALLAGALVGVALVAGVGPGARAEEEPSPEPTVVLDRTFFDRRIAPILAENCATCHANPRKRLGRHFLLPAPGRRVRDRHLAKNLETIRRYIVPGDPSRSTWLLKALGPRQGGVEHGGGQRIAINSAEYGAMVDFINGAAIAPEPFTPPAPVEGAPDFRFFVAKVAPVLAEDCASCHGGRGKGRHKLVVAEDGEALDLRDHVANFETILKLVTPGNPDKSRLLLKPLAVEDGGLAHKGGDRFRRGDGRHAIFEAFIRGDPGPPLPSERPPTQRRLTAAGLVLEAEDLERAEGVDEVEDPDAGGFLAIEPLEGGGRVAAVIEVADALAYRVVARWRGGGDGARLRVGATVDSPLVALAPDAPTDRWHDRGVRHLVDGDQPLRDARGTIALGADGIELDGRRGVAGFLVPDPPTRRGCRIEVTVPVDEDGGDDALLLFDALDLDEARFAGLVDGGRRFAIGHLEGGRPHVAAAVVTPERDDDGPEPRRVIRVERFGGVAVASLDDRPLLHLDLGDDAPVGTYGVRTRGRLDVHRVAAVADFDVTAAEFGEAPVVRLEPGPQAIEIVLPENAGRLDAIRFEPIR